MSKVDAFTEKFEERSNTGKRVAKAVEEALRYQANGKFDDGTTGKEEPKDEDMDTDPPKEKETKKKSPKKPAADTSNGEAPKKKGRPPKSKSESKSSSPKTKEKKKPTKKRKSTPVEDADEDMPAAKRVKVSVTPEELERYKGHIRAAAELREAIRADNLDEAIRLLLSLDEDSDEADPKLLKITKPILKASKLGVLVKKYASHDNNEFASLCEKLYIRCKDELEQQKLEKLEQQTKKEKRR
jgi:hypothetical protein